MMTKVDVFIKADDEWTNEVWRCRQYIPVSIDGAVNAYLPSAEDAILQKIRWFQVGGGVSDQQWSDILGMLRMQAEKLHYGYLREWAPKLGLSELLEKAISMSHNGQ